MGLRSGPESSGDSTIRAVSSWRIIVDPKRMAFNICQTTGSVAFNDSSSTLVFSSDIGISLSPFIFHCALRTCEKPQRLVIVSSGRVWKIGSYIPINKLMQDHWILRVPDRGCS